MGYMETALSASTTDTTATARIARGTVAIVAGSALVAICSHISVPLPFTPVPLYLNPLGVLLVGLFLEPAAAFAALVLFLAEGAAGLPVFSPYGPGGMLQLLGPTGGYLFAYPVTAALMSWLSRRVRPASFSSVALAATAGDLVVLAGGATWFAFASHLSASAVLKMTVWPFLPGEALKVIATAAIAMGALKLRNKFRSPSPDALSRLGTGS